MKGKRLLGAAAALLALTAGGTAGAAIRQADTAAVSVTACDELPALWSGAHEIEYLPQSATIHFVWAGEQVSADAHVSTSDTGCESQPGLRDLATNLAVSHEQTEREACLDLKTLVENVREQNPDAEGRVELPASIDGEVARRRGHLDHLDERSAQEYVDALTQRNEAAPQRSVDLDEADTIIRSSCP